MRKIIIPIIFIIIACSEKKVTSEVSRLFVGEYKLDLNTSLKKEKIFQQNDSIIIKIKKDKKVYVYDNGIFFRGDSGVWSWIDTEMGYRLHIEIENDSRKYRLLSIDTAKFEMCGLVFLNSKNQKVQLFGDSIGVFTRIKK